ncbi:laminin subunit alpha [Prorops nasuta]|uniref:laminin subunit alpha n=1 Tax=Prorops nasuta TaxID=863751 RepID=UPI0034CE91F9
MLRWLLVICLASLAIENTLAEILTPPYFNLAEGKEIIASATCGVDTPGPELYCKLVGANSDPDEDINLIQGQVCDYCDENNPEKRHPPEYAVDGSETWWQSPPLSRSMKYNNVTLTINLAQEFHVAYVFIKMGNSPRPGLWILEKSKDYGKTWQPWQYFSDSESDCLKYFGVDAQTPITRDDSVICSLEYSKIVPLEGGEIVISILNNRPSAKNYFNSTLLQEWTRATNVRFRFLRTKNLLGHLMSVAREDPTVTRRYFYSIKDISIGGRCMCNGHADTCDVLDPNMPNKLVCRCQHNTCGPQCASCCKGFEQKKWRISTAFKKFTCEPCNCFGHSDECEYDPEADEKHLSLDIHGNYEGGGRCKNCKHNTRGINCNECQPQFYRPRDKPLNATDACQPCDCNHFYSTGNCSEFDGKCECRKEFTPPNCDSCSYGYYGYPKCRPCDCNIEGTDGYQCEANEGFCSCKPNFAGHHCDHCAEGYYKINECLPCQCNPLGALSNICDVISGNCTCKNNYGARSCDICEDGYFNYPVCQYCDCDTKGTEPGICNKVDGTCLCKPGYGGPRCDQCINGYYGYPNCKSCNCSSNGSSSTSCDSRGKCSCLANFAGRTCDQCSAGNYLYPSCIACNCDSHGSIGTSCDAEGMCQCRENFDGQRCDKCKEGYYNFPICEGCNCDPAGVVETFQGCGTLPSNELCQCKERVEGRICNSCKPLYWNLQPYNPDGCEQCHCNIPGVIGGIGECNTKTGQCNCKPGVTDRDCSKCVDGTYNLQEGNLFGCSDCFCDIGGSVNSICDKISGQCPCQPRITGLTCKEPLQAHYFPTLHQFKYEAENGRTPDDTPVSYGISEEFFPGYSWKGYAVFSILQNEILLTVDIYKSSVYRMVIYYVNSNNESILGTIKITPDNPADAEQSFQVHFKPSRKPSFVTVAGADGIRPSPMVINPGRWSISIMNKKSLFVDYIVLLPAEYYEATILTQDVNVPCEVGYKGLCRQYGYPNLMKFDSVHGAGGFLNENNIRIPLTEYFTDKETLKEIGENEVPLINDKQEEIHFELRISKPGPHVLLITYVTSKNENSTSVLLIEANSVGKGKATLYPCRYTNICRQVVTDVYNRVAIMNFPSNYVTLVLTGEPTSNVAINSVVAIPIQDWSLDYIKPKSVCVKKNGKCVQGIFPEASEAKKIEFETTSEDSEHLPQGIFDNTTKLIYLNEKNPMVDVHAKVPEAGDYIFVVQYYQPDHPEYALDVLVQNGKFYEGKVKIDHCPSNSGCRSIVKQIDGSNRFHVMESFVISLKENFNNGLWLDYILVIPADHFNEKILKKVQFDQTKEFIKKCGTNHFYINVTEAGFCRDSVFSLTADYNNGALACHCDREGSTDFECSKFGGQCPCKPNIVGRRCEYCKNNYYGFPYCRPCICPRGNLCDPETGDCYCPPKVTGEFCDKCINGTYGYDPFIGCRDCSCSPLGVVPGNLQCDLFTGECNCKENVVDRQCDKCRAGYSQFPYCEKCDCDIRGTTTDICDQYTAECFCKNNVQGSACDVCKEGTFNLQDNNEQGCTKCFCFGKTTRCTSANLYWSQTMDMVDWDLASVDEKSGNISSLPLALQGLNSTSFVIDLVNNDEVVYFSAPQTYLGKRITSYGGHLNYTVHYTTGPFGKAVSRPDVILSGGNIVLFYYGEEQPPSFTSFRGSVQLVESNFLTVNRQLATREQIMIVLEDLEGLYIRATYWNQSITATLSYAILDIPTDHYSPKYSVPASSVEQCQCPPNYQGSSCEECAPGYYRVQSGPYGGYCVKCQCHGHSDTCDVNTGVCTNCKNGTTGDHCEYCEQGYYGNATIGTPSDCLICVCPLPVPSNNFATGCEVNEEGNKISCDCLPGYYGARCQACAAGFYGNPEVYGDYCKPCECSGNIDTNQVGSCDSITGECLQCLNNTYGKACNLCKPGFFGDAIDRKDCQSCLCDTCGMEECDNRNGQCHCKENVVGEKCDSCEVNHYGFNSCDGCKPCDCGLASESSQCDDETGQCRCKPGVTGRKCDQCIAGYWDYGPDGCTSCGCNTGYSVGASCNVTTGQCTCLPGVIGEKCDHCPYRNVLLEGQGCFQCGSCAGDLLDVTDELAGLLDPVFYEFNQVADSYFTHQRLRFINDTVNELYPEVKLLDPSRVNLFPLQQKLTSLDQEVSSQKRRVEYTAEDSLKWKQGAQQTLKDMNDLEQEVVDEIKLVNSVVSEVQTLSQNIELGSAAKVDSALKEAQDILKKIQEVSFVTFRDQATDNADQANIIFSSMIEYNFPVNNLSSIASEINEKMKNATEKMDDLARIAKEAEQLARDVERLNKENRVAAVTGNLEIIKNFTMEAQEDLDVGSQLNTNASQFLEEATTNMEILASNALDNTMNDLNASISDNDQMLLDILDLVQNANTHSSALHSLSLDMDNLLEDTRNTKAVRAVSAYKDIVKAIEIARDNSEEARDAANNATSLLDGFEESMKNSRNNSTILLAEAEDALRKTVGRSEENLQQARAGAKSIDEQNKRNKEILDNIDKVLANSPSESSSQAQRAKQEATYIEASIQQGIEYINDVVNKIPLDVKEAKQLSKNTSESIRDVSQAKKQLDIVDRVSPQIVKLINGLNATQAGIENTGNDLRSKIEALRNKIANARELADRFKVGLTFYRNTTLELKNPENLPLLATSTKISVYFKTNKTNGFLLYLGNEDKTSPRVKSHDFMALLIESGYPVFIVDLGSGPEKVILNKYVADDVWRKIEVDRTGKNVKLRVVEDAGEGQEVSFLNDAVILGTNSIFNLDQDQSKLFVGGYPPSFQIQDAVTASSFEGQMEELVIGDTPVSFWNFMYGENNRQRARERDKLVNLQPSTGFRFDRSGYAIISRRNLQIPVDSKKFGINLNFKTFTGDGLIYLMGNNKQFLALEIRNGNILYQYDLGEGEITLSSPMRYNDGQWHSLEARRLGKIGLLKIDGQMVAKGEVGGEGKSLVAPDHIYFGGYLPNESHMFKPVTNLGFDGCIDNVVILETSVDLSRNVQAFGVVPGCPVRFASIVAFEENTPGYVRWRNISAIDTLQVNLKFKTLASNGLIFYVADDYRNTACYLALLNGDLVFNSQGVELKAESNGIKFNDNEWHVVTASYTARTLLLDIDDTKNYSSDSSPLPLNLQNANLFIGGLPKYVKANEPEVQTPFVGCIGDTTVNGAIVNFANTTEKPNAYLGKCKGGQPPLPPVVGPEINWPNLLPTEENREPVDETTQINIVDVDIDKNEEEEPTLEGRGKEREGPPKIPTTTPAALLPETVDNCHLPYYPAVDPDPENAWRFGTVRNSRLEYRSLTGTYKNKYDFQIDIKTLADEGIIFYGTDLTRLDLIAVYVLEGRIHYKFDCGSGPALLTSKKKINDNQWHNIIFKREGNYGELAIDDEPEITGYSEGHTMAINVSPPFYVGGVLPELNRAASATIGVNKTFSGCLGNFMLNGQQVGEASAKIGVIPCSKRVELGLFFYPGNGSNLFKAIDKFNVGREIDIQMDIKPRSTSGHLLSVHGRRDHLVLEMVNGTIKFLVKTLKGAINSTFVPAMPNSLCDGNWHNIRAVKQKNAVLLSVDHKSASPGIAEKIEKVLSRHPMFIGGHPLLGKLRGSTSQAQYVGCMRNIWINTVPISIDADRTYGEVLANVCPTI